MTHNGFNGKLSKIDEYICQVIGTVSGYKKWLGLLFNLNWAWEDINSSVFPPEGNNENNSVITNFNR